MPLKNLSQVVAYISPELRKRMDHDRAQFHQRVSVSAYIEGVLRQHLANKEDGPRRNGRGKGRS